MRGRKPRAVARGGAVPTVKDGLPRCPAHLSDAARREWRRLATPLHGIGVLTLADRAALAAYCQAWGRWVEAETQLQRTPPLLKTPSGYVQQSPWLAVANKQLEIMGRYMAELGLTPVSRSRVASAATTGQDPDPLTIRFVTVYEDAHGTVHETPIPDPRRPDRDDDREDGRTITVDYDPRI